MFPPAVRCAGNLPGACAVHKRDAALARPPDRRSCWQQSLTPDCMNAGSQHDAVHGVHAAGQNCRRWGCSLGTESGCSCGRPRAPCTSGCCSPVRKQTRKQQSTGELLQQMMAPMLQQTLKEMAAAQKSRWRRQPCSRHPRRGRGQAAAAALRLQHSHQAAQSHLHSR